MNKTHKTTNPPPRYTVERTFITEKTIPELIENIIRVHIKSAAITDQQHHKNIAGR